MSLTKPGRPTQRRGRPPTLRDVAERAGVSMMTVSNVINQRTARVSEETRAQIHATIDELGYRPQRSGRSLRMQREYSIGLTIVRPDRRFLDDPYATEIAAGMSNELASAGYGLMVNGVPDLEALTTTVTRVANVDALAVFASGPRPLREAIYSLFERLHHPLAVIQDDVADLPDSCCFIQDDEAGGRMIAEGLIAAGARRFLFAAPDTDWPAIERREAGVRAAATDGAANVATIRCNENDFTAIIDAVLDWFDRKGVPDAIIGGNDQIGIAAIHAAASRGIAVPDELMVTGFNAFPFRRFSKPLISSVSSPAYALGEAVAHGLLSRVENGGFEEARKVLPVRSAPGETVRRA